MRKRCILILTALLTCTVLAAGAAAAEPKVNVILFGWDGAQRNHVNECLKRDELPVLKKLAAEGAMVEIDIVGTTDTKAGWSEILTGYGPKITGVHSNRNYQPIPEGYTVFERLREEFGADKIATVAVIGKKRHVGGIDAPKKHRLDAKKKAGAAAEGKKAKRKAQPKGRIVTEDGVKYRLVAGAPYYHTHKNVDEWHFGLMADKKVGTKALELLDKYKSRPFFFFVHFAEVDHMGHKHGENSKAYNGALISNDTWTGRILDKLKELKLYDKTWIYITADHGFDEGKKSHKKAPHVFLATNDKKVTRGGARVDVTPTILQRFGLDLGKIDPPLTGSPLTGPAKAKPKAKAKAAAN